MKKLLGFMNLAALFAAVTFVYSCQKEDFQDTPRTPSKMTGRGRRTPAAQGITFLGK